MGFDDARDLSGVGSECIATILEACGGVDELLDRRSDAEDKTNHFESRHGSGAIG